MDYARRNYHGYMGQDVHEAEAKMKRITVRWTGTSVQGITIEGIRGKRKKAEYYV